MMTDRTSTEHSSRGEPSAAEEVVEGIGVVPGVVVGTACLYRPGRPDVDRTEIAEAAVPAELALFEEALERAREAIEQVRGVAEQELGPDGEAIFEAQEMMVRDDELEKAVRRRIRNDQVSAAHALTGVLREHRRRIEDSDDEYLRERANDLVELETRLLRALEQEKTVGAIEPDSVVVADRLTAADVIRFHREGVRGCVAEQGGRTSHVSILARALDLPTVVGAEGVTDAVVHADTVLLDGHRGRLVIHPADTTIERYRRRQEEGAAPWMDEASPGPPTYTSDGHRVHVRANVDLPETLDLLRQQDAEGIGLLRTELVFAQDLGEPASEDRQLDLYRRAASIGGEHGATVRLFDFGGDKGLPASPTEDNPVLGGRGIRLLLDQPDDLLRPQLRALLRANVDGTLRVLLPMVTQVDEVRRVRALLAEEADRLAAAGTEHDPDLPVGIMVETPVVALQASAFAEAADFFAIGTNDLTQYVLAVDRGNDRVASRFDALHPAVLRLVRQSVQAGREAQIPVSVCGEVASDVLSLPILLGLGVDELSVAPSHLRILRTLIPSISTQEAQSLTEAACSAPDAAAVRRQVQAWLSEHTNIEADVHPISSNGASTSGDRSPGS
jgi:phosphotransferase system enzyme I (PtsI)